MTGNRELSPETKAILDRLAAKTGHKRVDEIDAQNVLPFDGPKSDPLPPRRRWRGGIGSSPAQARLWYVEKDKGES